MKVYYLYLVDGLSVSINSHVSKTPSPLHYHCSFDKSRSDSIKRLDERSKSYSDHDDKSPNKKTVNIVFTPIGRIIKKDIPAQLSATQPTIGIPRCPSIKSSSLKLDYCGKLIDELGNDTYLKAYDYIKQNVFLLIY